jgi:predicted transcriptional regulator
MPAVVRLLQSHRSVAGIGQSWPTASAISSSGISNGQLTRPHARHTPQTLPPLSLPRTAITTRSGGRQPAVVVATHWQRKANSLRMTSVVIRSGGRQPAVVVATHWQRKANSLRMTSVRIRSGEREPAVAVATHGQRKANSLRMTSVRIRSGGRKPAVGMRNTFAQTQAPAVVCSRIGRRRRCMCGLPLHYARRGLVQAPFAIAGPAYGG